MNATRQRLRNPAPADVFLLAFGAFLGLALVKFGNPVVLDAQVEPPKSFSDLWSFAWPPRYGLWLLLPIAFAGALIIFRHKLWPIPHPFWLLPIAWLLWQLIASTHSVDAQLTWITVLHFGGCVGSYLLGAALVRDIPGLKFLLAGLMIAFVFCLMRAVDQRLFEFPQERQFLIESEQRGFTNMPPELFLNLKRQNVIISTNNVEIVNPAYLAKYTRGRVHGTLVYPNALAGALLLLLPAALVLVLEGTRPFRPATRVLAAALILFLGLGSLFWTGSKSGWLIALGMCGAWFLRLNWSRKLKFLVVLGLLAAGLTLFGLRFHSYFAAGATSVGARFDYWRAAVQITAQHPILGTGPGTFQHPYQQQKRPEAEMARLTHNDYLEQFSDSGIVGGCLYLAWISLLSIRINRRIWDTETPLYAAAGLGVLAWFFQGLSEFSLYVPGLAWIAFALAGALLCLDLNRIDKPTVAR